MTCTADNCGIEGCCCEGLTCASNGVSIWISRYLLFLGIWLTNVADLHSAVISSISDMTAAWLVNSGHDDTLSWVG